MIPPPTPPEGGGAETSADEHAENSHRLIMATSPAGRLDRIGDLILLATITYGHLRMGTLRVVKGRRGEVPTQCSRASVKGYRATRH